MKLTTLLTIILFVNSAAGQGPRIFNGDNGLAQGFVSSVIQDRNGFIWAGTQHGLSRYDGTRFKNFYQGDNSSYSLISNKIQKLLIDTSGKIWIVNGSGIQWFDAKSGRFVLPEYFKTNSLKFFKDAFIDEQNRLWVLQKDDLVCLKINPGKNCFVLEKVYAKTFRKDQMATPNVVFADDSTVWIGSDAGIKKYDWKLDRVINYSLPKDGKVYQIWKDKHFGGIWIQMGNGTIYMRDSEIKWFPEIKSSPYLKFDGASGQKSTFITNKIVFMNGMVNPLPPNLMICRLI